MSYLESVRIHFLPFFLESIGKRQSWNVSEFECLKFKFEKSILTISNPNLGGFLLRALLRFFPVNCLAALTRKK